ncbi:TonB-linked outer membrane protein, SusC/RagA family [Chryseobacterium soldanellicola]|uniref:TonB-linked outer membrane protein, SusC/RagA family n=1 Tax=Chryseobacterium soldanellicola TaxID=311333 RepID=A0A1H1DTZ4_9FLAO|nr:SusC/RagA family TonB-linked outer membrane protein [Chryseobacterium soldanellicola]SDQ79708.1 TonB-linked outer membrane protein, SusC/RagA family [Chryseobacterium soldanellicola]
MKKITSGVLVLVLSSSLVIANAQQKKDTVRTQDIEGVVVTALGIKREKKSLGYSSQEVKGEDINKAPTANFLNNLSGKVAGLDIKQGTNFGGSTNVVLRGFKSIDGNNQALFVVDGVPIINSNINSTDQKTARGGYDYGNTASDINPNDIESINVLKGAAATALYGSRAQNGAIIITTKKGSKRNKGIGVEYSSSFTISSVDKSTFPKYQTEYGQGYLGQTFGTYLGGPRAIFGHDASYGPRYDGSLVWQYDAFIPGSSTFGQKTPWEMAENGPISFFDVGTNAVNNISLNGGNDVATYRFSYGNTYATDIMPNSKINKNNFAGNASYKFTDKLTANLYANFVTQRTQGRSSTGYGDNVMSNFRQWWATNVDLKEQEALYNLSHQNYTWNIKSVSDIRPQYWDNPYFKVYENYQTDARDRLAINASLNYDLTPDINLLGRVGRDGYTMKTEERRAKGSVAAPFGLNDVDQPSGYALSSYNVSETNYDFIATYKKTLNDFNINALLGTNLNVQTFESNQQSTSGGLVIPGLYTISNSASSPALPVIGSTEKRIFGAFAQASFGYKGTYYLEGTVRRDQSTALPKNNNVYWYPSISGSVVFSNLIKQNWLSFGKLRAAYAQVGSDTGADNILNRYLAQYPFSSPMYSYSTLARNPDIKPQRLNNVELGVNMDFFKNRIGFDVAWFKNSAFDQIINLPVTTSSGFVNRVTNAGTLETKGFEISGHIIPVKTTNFTWNIDVNWSNPNTKVVKLAPGIENVQLGSLQGGVSINAPLNQDYGTIWGADFVYSPDGQKVIGKNGAYLSTASSDNNLGSFQSKWMGGLRNSLTYKNLSLSFLIDVKQGGKVFSLDQYYGYGTGLYPDSVGFNDLGNPIRNTIANGGGIILPGVMVDPTSPNNYVPNTIRLDKSQSSQVLGTDPPPAAFVYDASFVKLREVAISYKLPNSLLASTFLRDLTLGLVGTNLWIIHKNLPYADPEAGLSSGNIQGYQSGPMPATRNIAFTLKANF